MLRHLSKIATKITGSGLKHSDYNIDRLDEFLNGLNKMEMGIDKVLDDKMLEAQKLFNCPVHQKDQTSSNSSPYIAFGNALYGYIISMLTLDINEIEAAAELLDKLQIHLLRSLNECKKRRKRAATAIESVGCRNKIEAHLELLNAHCIFMTATLQIVRNSWFDNIKAIYDFRKALKIYENLMESQLGITTEHCKGPITDSMATKKRISGEHLPCLKKSKQWHMYEDAQRDFTLESGIYFGLGLFNMVLSLSPLKVRRILNSLGYHSTVPLSIHFLEKCQKSTTMYTFLSSLVLLLFFTNISPYIQPQLNSFVSVYEAKKLLKQAREKFPEGRLWYLFEGKLQLLAGGSTEDCLELLSKAKQPTTGLKPEYDNVFNTSHLIASGSAEISIDQLSITNFSQFRCWILYETGWAHIYSGNYLLATESFFALESLCKSSSLFYHYIATCCMLAASLYGRASLEVRQMASLLDHKKKKGFHLSANEQYVEAKVRYWIMMAASNTTQSGDNNNNIKKVLQTYQESRSPIWELLYLWNGLQYCKKEVIVGIKEDISKRWIGISKRVSKNGHPLYYLILGVIHRDIDNNFEQAMDYFEAVLSMVITSSERQQQQWVIPYAMYEIAVTSRLKDKERSVNTVTIWIQNIKNYYAQNPEDKEWDNRMELRCQLLEESCCHSSENQNVKIMNLVSNK